MTMTWFACGMAAFTLFALVIYRRIWIRTVGTTITPTGCGLILAVDLVIAAILLDMPTPYTVAFAVLAIATVLYWFDDVVQLSARWRLLLSFITGGIFCGALLRATDPIEWWFWSGFCVAAGVVNVVLTNIVNFYDGADLNLATFIALTAGCMIWFGLPGDPLYLAGATALAFVVPFAVLNSRPKSIYLGDAGSFAFASLLTIMAIVYLRGNVPAEMFVPAALPALDTFWVFCIRISERQDLMSRNYLHLYQQLQKNYPRFLYLLPQIVTVILVLAGAALLQNAGIRNFLSVSVSILIVTPLIYFSARKCLLPVRAYGEVG